MTGAANGMGRAVALAYAAQGANVFAVDIDEDALSDLPRSAAFATFVAAVDSEAEVRGAVDSCVSQFGGIDVVYNNAGVYLRGRGDTVTHELELDVWNRVMSVNLTSAFLVSKYALPHMMGAGGSIINIASVGGMVASDCHAYSASKGALMALTRSQANSYGRYGIRVNAIAPGVVDTGMAAPVTGDAAVADRYRASTPLGRFARTDDIVGLAIFLASDDSAYMTGTSLPVDGGLVIRP
ncbi:dihydroanticapsin 7-dehydrogenase [Pseudonocardia ailaonensis]|uniref:Dihydroanticapsin 7-dehydrogenase n=1 Tax=Pseudonocardia ailaonensis TaxID=367279 RepID=A0ABN2N5R4_9PSEU